MATYKQIQAYVKENYGFMPKPCWIAHMKEICGIPVKTAHNRNEIGKRMFPCPADKMEHIKSAFVHFGMI